MRHLQLFRAYSNPRVLAIGCIAYANGLPLLLTSSTLGIWLKSYGLNYTSIGLFGLLHFPYSLKFLWAPFLDQVPLPFLKKHLGQRRSWLCLVQITAIFGIWGMAFFDPIQSMAYFVACGFLTTLSAASQHVILLTYQMETLRSQEWGLGEGIGVLGYRIAILTSGAGALYLATYLNWQTVYLLISFLMFIGLITVLVMREPDTFAAQHNHPFVNWREWCSYTFIGPFKDFITQKGWIDILIFMVVYRLPENLSSMMIAPFFLDLGFNYIEISHAKKIFGLMAVIFGGIMGGIWIRTHGYKRVLLRGGCAYGISYLLFLVQQHLGHNLPFLYLSVGVEHFWGGVTLTGFFTYQLTCCNVKFAATQLALLTSLANLGHTLMPPLAGYLVDLWGWSVFILCVSFSSLLGIIWVLRIPFSRP